MEKLAVNVREAAEMMGIGISNMYILVHRADFPAIRAGNRIIIPIEALREWMKKEAGNII